MICDKCGQITSNDSLFCENCGASVAESSENNSNPPVLDNKSLNKKQKNMLLL